MIHDEYHDFLERQFTEMSDQLHALKQVLKPAIELAKDRKEGTGLISVYLNITTEALLEAGRILGVKND